MIWYLMTTSAVKKKLKKKTRDSEDKATVMTNAAAQEMKEGAADQGKQNVDMTITKEPENRMRGKGEKREEMAAVMTIEGKKEEKNGREEKVQAVMMRIERDKGR